MSTLEELRERLNRIDEQLITALGERYEVCRAVAKFKKENNIPMMQPARVEEVKNRCAAMAEHKNVNPEFVRNLYGLIIAEACRLEDSIIDNQA
jgi:chorismate mutase